MRQLGVGTFTTTPKMKELVNQVLDSNRISYGPMSREFERKFARMHGCKYAVLSNSGTSALHIALQAMKEIHGWEDGDEVVVPAVTFVATINIVLHNNMKPVLVDIDPISYNMDVFEVAKASSEKTRAVIPVHLFGQPADVAVLRKMNKRLKVIEDSCESMLAYHRGKPVGSLGDIGCFSTYVAHLITTGVGGISTTSNPEYAAKMRSLVNHGRDGIYIAMDDDTGKSGGEREEIVSRRFNFDSIGHSFRVTELEAALGLAQLDDLEQMIQKRTQNALALKKGLKGLPLQLPYTYPGNTHSFMMYPIVVLEGNKWDLCNYLESKGIETREMLPLTNQKVYVDLFDEDDFPTAKFINENGFYIGCHQDLAEEDIQYIVNAFHTYYDVQQLKGLCS